MARIRGNILRTLRSCIGPSSGATRHLLPAMRGEGSLNQYRAFRTVRSNAECFFLLPASREKEAWINTARSEPWVQTRNAYPFSPHRGEKVA